MLNKHNWVWNYHCNNCNQNWIHVHVNLKISLFKCTSFFLKLLIIFSLFASGMRAFDRTPASRGRDIDVFWPESVSNEICYCTVDTPGSKARGLRFTGALVSTELWKAGDPKRQGYYNTRVPTIWSLWFQGRCRIRLTVRVFFGASRFIESLAAKFTICILKRCLIQQFAGVILSSSTS